MSDYRRADEVWEEDEVDEDDAKTLVARNPLRDPADEQEQASGSAQASERGPEPAGDASARDSTISVRDSEIELLGDADGSTASGTGPASAGPAEDSAKAEPEAAARPSLEVLRDSEVDRLLADVDDAASAEAPAVPAPSASASGKKRPAPPMPKDEPSIAITDLEIIEESTAVTAVKTDAAARTSDAPSASDETTPVVVRAKGARSEATERISTLPRTHPFANSIAPTAAPKSVPPEGPRTNAWSLVLVAIVFLALGGLLARLQDGMRTADNEVSTGATQVAAAARVAEPSEPAPEAVRAEAAEPVAEPSEAVAAADEAVPPPAEDSAPTLVSADSSAATGGRGLRSVAADSPVPARRERRKAQSEGEVPAQPSREAVVAVMDAIRPELEKCTGGRRGIAEVSLTVRPEGRVSYAVVDGSFAGSPEGTCMAQALRQAKFPAFSDPMLRVKYPFQF